MRTAVWIVLVLGCHKDAAPTSTGSGGSTGPAPVGKIAADAAIDAPAVAPPAIELLHNVPTTVRVSSRVANKTILPVHLVDRDLQTAWSSATNDLVGAWIEVTVPEAATVTEIRLTAGHTGKGPKGEDYFTMNPRVTKVSVWGGGKQLANVALDPARRDLQTIAVRSPGGALAINVEAIIPGSKKAWREIAISELEVWGTPPPGWVAPSSPLVPQIEVGDPNAGTHESLDAMCEAILVGPRQAYAADSATAQGPDGDEAPTCDSKAFEIKKPKLPWTDAGVVCFEHPYSLTGSAHGQRDCSIAVATDHRWWTGRAIETPPSPPDPPRNYWTGAEVFDAFVFDAPAPMLVVRFRTTAGDELHDYVTVCRTSPKRGCSEPMSTEGYDWKLRPVQNGTDLELVKESGDPPADELGTITTLLKF